MDPDEWLIALTAYRMALNIIITSGYNDVLNLGMIIS